MKMKAFLTFVFFAASISVSAMAASSLNKMHKSAKQVRQVRPLVSSKSSHRVLQTDRIETITPEMRGLHNK